MKRNVLFLAHRLPYPPDKGERVRAFHEIRALAEGFDVTVAALTHNAHDEAAAEELRNHCPEVVTAPAGGAIGLARGAGSLLRGGSVTQGFFHSPGLMRSIERLGQARPFDIAVGYCSAVLDMLLRVGATARVLDLVDVDSLKWDDYASKARGLRRWLYARESAGVRRLEVEAIRRCDAVLAVSDSEAHNLENVCPPRRVLPVGNGVDLDYFRARQGSERADPCVVFTGTMSYPPNAKGVCWFVREVWPRVRTALPGARFTIVGRDPTDAVRRLAREPGVEVTGAVADVRPYLASSAVAVAPLHIARGIQNKVLEAMAMARPVVASPDALVGIEADLQNGDAWVAAATAGRSLAAEVLQASEPEVWARTIVKLLAMPELRRTVGTAARSRVERSYSWSSRMAPLVKLCKDLTRAQPQVASR